MNHLFPDGKVRLTREAAPSFTALLNEFENSSLQVDGRYLPPDCIPRYQVAIIVPYRNRFEHLNIFLRNIHPFLQKQQLDYTIFVVEQAGTFDVDLNCYDLKAAVW